MSTLMLANVILFFYITIRKVAHHASIDMSGKSEVVYMLKNKQMLRYIGDNPLPSIGEKFVYMQETFIVIDIEHHLGNFHPMILRHFSKIIVYLRTLESEEYNSVLEARNGDKKYKKMYR